MLDRKYNFLPQISLLGALCAIIVISIIAFNIMQLKTAMTVERYDQVRHVVEMTIGVANHYYRLHLDNKMTEEEAKKHARDSIRAMKSSDNGYQLVFRSNGICEVHGAIPTNEGKQRIELLTSDGKYVVKEFISAAHKGGGYVPYNYPKPGIAGNDYPKIAYVQYFEPWDWVVATGLYVDDIDAAFMEQIKSWGQIIAAPIALLLLLTIHLAQMIRKPFVALEKAKEEAVVAYRAKTNFLANVSHEIRTPLTSILGGLGVVVQGMGGKLSEEVLKPLEIAHKNTNRLLILVNDLLDLSKVDAGRMTIENVPFNLMSSVEKVVDTMLIRSKEKQIELQVHYRTLLPKEVMGDPVRLEQILLNLLSNAIKFTDKGSVKLFIGSRELSEDIISLLVEVVDTGIGIADDKMEYIFEKFTQGDESMTRRFGGTGLGLAISRDLVRLMGGTLKVESKVGVGSTFYFEIPLKKAA